MAKSSITHGDNPRPSQVRQMTEPERAWVGAAIDSEGNIRIVARLVTGARNYGFKVSNTSVEFISALVRATGIGTVYPEKRMQAHYQQCWSWLVHRKEDAIDVAQQVQQYSIKAQKLIALSEHQS